MRLIAVSARRGQKGSVLSTAEGLNVVISDHIPTPSVVDVSLGRFWAYKDKPYASAELISYRQLEMEDL